jgi:hypothetical protein
MQCMSQALLGHHSCKHQLAFPKKDIFLEKSQKLLSNLQKPLVWSPAPLRKAFFFHISIIHKPRTAEHLTALSFISGDVIDYISKGNVHTQII